MKINERILPFPPLYAHNDVQAQTGPTVRPGGFLLTDRALEYCRFSPGSRLLDVGCGQGASVDRMRKRWNLSAMGVDPSSAMLACGKGLPLIQGTGEQIPFAEETFDGIICECVLGATANPALILREFFRVLKPGGRVFISDIYARNPQICPCAPSLPITCCFNGARPFEDHIRTIEDQGLTSLLVEDHSQKLRDLAAQIVWNHGSLAQFWAALFPSLDTTCIVSRINAIKPGLFLCIAHKELI